MPRSESAVPANEYPSIPDRDRDSGGGVGAAAGDGTGAGDGATAGAGAAGAAWVPGAEEPAGIGNGFGTAPLDAHAPEHAASAITPAASQFEPGNLQITTSSIGANLFVPQGSRTLTPREASGKIQAVWNRRCC